MNVNIHFIKFHLVKNLKYNEIEINVQTKHNKHNHTTTTTEVNKKGSYNLDTFTSILQQE